MSNMKRNVEKTYAVAVAYFVLVPSVDAFFTPIPSSSRTSSSLHRDGSWCCSWSCSTPLQSTGSWKENNNIEYNISSESAYNGDWETTLRKKNDGSFWSEFEFKRVEAVDSNGKDDDNDDKSETMLDIMASLQAEEIHFNIREAQRADTLRQMEDWGFEPSTIASALNVAIKEPPQEEEMSRMQNYRSDMYLDSDDLRTVESHTKVPQKTDTNEPIRNQMVYVDEHACIGCTNCAMIAQSTFFMEEENGRARVFEQWGDDETTVQIAVDTCPVDCIHYVSYDELVDLEVKRRNQYINVVAGLVSRAERGAGSGRMSSTPRSFGSKTFTDAPKISRRTVETTRLEAKKDLSRRQQERRRALEEERRQANKIMDL